MDRYSVYKKTEHRTNHRFHRKLAFLLSVLLLCSNIWMSGNTLTARADEPVNDISGNNLSGNDISVDPPVVIDLPEPAVSDNTSEPAPALSDNESVPDADQDSVSDNESLPDADPDTVSGNESGSEEPENPENPENPYTDDIAENGFLAEYEEIVEYFMPPVISRVDKDADYLNGVYYALAGGSYRFYIENEISYLICRYNGGEEYLPVKDGIAEWKIPDDFYARVSFGYEGTEGTYVELFGDILFNDTIAPKAVIAQDPDDRRMIRLEISESGKAKSGIRGISCRMDGEETEIASRECLQEGEYRGESVWLLCLNRIEARIGIHEISLTLTDAYGNVREVTETIEIKSTGVVMATIPTSFTIPMKYDPENRQYDFVDGSFVIKNNGENPLKVSITNITVSVDKTLPAKAENNDELKAAAAEKSVECDVTASVIGQPQTSCELKEGHNKNGISFILGSRKADQYTYDPSEVDTDDFAVISFTGHTNETPASVWESGDLLILVTFALEEYLPETETEVEEELAAPLAAPKAETIDSAEQKTPKADAVQEPVDEMNEYLPETDAAPAEEYTTEMIPPGDAGESVPAEPPIS